MSDFEFDARVRIPEQARQGEVIEIRTLASHPMETGYRRDAQGERVPREIVTRFRCTYAGREAFSADLEPAIAANPYLVFHLRADVSGEIVLEWDDDHGRHLEKRGHLEVTDA